MVIIPYMSLAHPSSGFEQVKNAREGQVRENSHAFVGTSFTLSRPVHHAPLIVVLITATCGALVNVTRVADDVSGALELTLE